MEHPSTWQQDCMAEGVHIMVGWKAESRKGPGAAITFRDMPLRTHFLWLNPTSSSSTASQSCAISRGTGTQHVSLEWTVAFQPKMCGIWSMIRTRVMDPVVKRYRE